MVGTGWRTGFRKGEEDPPGPRPVPHTYEGLFGRMSVTLSVGTPPRPYGMAYRRVCLLSTQGSFKKMFSSPLFGWRSRRMRKPRFQMHWQLKLAYYFS